MALGELSHPPDSGDVRGALGAEIGEPLLRISHPAGEIREHRVIGAGGRDHHALLLERDRERRHPSRGGAADVCVMGA